MKTAAELDAEREAQDDMLRHRETVQEEHDCPDCCGCGCCRGHH